MVRTAHHVRTGVGAVTVLLAVSLLVGVACAVAHRRQIGDSAIVGSAFVGAVVLCSTLTELQSSLFDVRTKTGIAVGDRVGDGGATTGEGNERVREKPKTHLRH